MGELYTVDLSMDDIMEALRLALKPFLGAGGIVTVQSQENRVPMPLGDFSTLTPISSTRLSTTTVKYSPVDGTASYSEVRKMDIQLDIYSEKGAEQAMAIETAFRSPLMYRLLTELDPRIVPLYSSTVLQTSMVNKEYQWQNRYLVMLTLQVIMTLKAPQEYFDVIELNLYEVDTETLGNKRNAK